MWSPSQSTGVHWSPCGLHVESVGEGKDLLVLHVNLEVVERHLGCEAVHKSEAWAVLWRAWLKDLRQFMVMVLNLHNGTMDFVLQSRCHV